MAEDSNPGVSPGKSARGNWADKVPLVTLLVVVFAAGGALFQLRAISDKLDVMSRKVDDDHDRIVRLEASQQFARVP